MKNVKVEIFLLYHANNRCLSLPQETGVCEVFHPERMERTKAGRKNRAGAPLRVGQVM